MSETETIDLAVGDRVVMRDMNERRMGGPRYGIVTKVGRKLVTVKAEDSQWQESVYRLDTGKANDRYGHGWFQTIAQHEDGKRRDELTSALREKGIDLRLGSARSISTDTLARLLAVFDG